MEVVRSLMRHGCEGRELGVACVGGVRLEVLRSLVGVDRGGGRRARSVVVIERTRLKAEDKKRAGARWIDLRLSKSQKPIIMIDRGGVSASSIRWSTILSGYSNSRRVMEDFL